MKKILQRCLLTSIGLFWTSCNIYKPFNATSTVEDYLEEAQACLHLGDYDCAIRSYLAMPTGEVRDQKLCLVYISKAGLTLNALINVVTQQNSNMLGALAQALTPWTSTRGADAVSAKSYCNTYASSSGNAKTAVLLKNLAFLADCATRMAKTDIFVGSSAIDSTCTTPGNRDGRVTQSDIGNTTPNYMCYTDVQACKNDIAGLDITGLGNAGATTIQSAVQLIPPNIAGGGTDDIVRTAIQSAANN